MSQTFDKKVKRRQSAPLNSISDCMGLQALYGTVKPIKYLKFLSCRLDRLFFADKSLLSQFFLVRGSTVGIGRRKVLCK